jgi:hypothetical protein
MSKQLLVLEEVLAMLEVIGASKGTRENFPKPPSAGSWNSRSTRSARRWNRRRRARSG